MSEKKGVEGKTGNLNGNPENTGLENTNLRNIGSRIGRNGKNSLLAGFLAMLGALLFSRDIALGALAFSACAGGCFILLSRAIPKAKERRRAEEAEAGLPDALLRASVCLDLNQKFEKAVEKMACSPGALGREFRRALGECAKGRPMKEALMGISERTGSRAVRRAMAQLAFSYEKMHTGKKGSGEALRALAKELFASQRIKLREFSGKMAMHSVLFIAVSAIIPALFESYSIVGSLFLEMTFSPQELFIIIAVVFPAIDALALLLFWAKTPMFMKHGKTIEAGGWGEQWEQGGESGETKGREADE